MTLFGRGVMSFLLFSNLLCNNHYYFVRNDIWYLLSMYWCIRAILLYTLYTCTDILFYIILFVIFYFKHYIYSNIVIVSILVDHDQHHKPLGAQQWFGFHYISYFLLSFIVIISFYLKSFKWLLYHKYVYQTS